MSGVSSSAIKKTASSELKTSTVDNSKFGTAIIAQPLKLVSNTLKSLALKASPAKEPALKLPPPQLPVKNTSPIQPVISDMIEIDGVKVPRFMPQETLRYHTEAELNDLGLDNVRSYVLDSYSIKDEIVGYGDNRVVVDHGDFTSNLERIQFHGKVAINKVDLSKAEYKDNTGDIGEIISKGLETVINAEMEIQNKSRKNLNLSKIIINISLGSDGKEYKRLTALMAEITSRGGQISLSAGNPFFATEAKHAIGTLIVDGTDDLIGGKISKDSIPSAIYNNQGSINGKDTRHSRKIHPSSDLRVAPSILSTRRAGNGDIEFKDINNPTGWTKIIDAKDTKKVPIDPHSSKQGFQGEKPSHLITLSDYKSFSKWWHKKTSDGKQESPSIKSEVRAELKRRFGDKAMISIEEYLNYCRVAPSGFDLTNYKEIMGSIPNGLSVKDVYFSYEKMYVDDIEPHKNILPYYVIDKHNKLKFIEQEANISTGTSWAAPVAGAQNMIAQLEYVRKVKQSRNMPNTRTKTSP
jgi:hypothetical protein